MGHHIHCDKDIAIDLLSHRDSPRSIRYGLSWSCSDRCHHHTWQTSEIIHASGAPVRRSRIDWGGHVLPVGKYRTHHDVCIECRYPCLDSSTHHGTSCSTVSERGACPTFTHSRVRHSLRWCGTGHVQRNGRPEALVAGRPPCPLFHSWLGNLFDTASQDRHESDRGSHLYQEDILLWDTLHASLRAHK